RDFHVTGVQTCALPIFISLGAQPTGLLYFATHELDTPCGAMITGSHNPAEFNGIKIVIDRHTLAQEELMGLYHRIKRGDLPRGEIGRASWGMSVKRSCI